MNTQPPHYFTEQLLIMGDYQWQIQCQPAALEFYRQKKHLFREENQQELDTIQNQPVEWIDVPEDYWDHLTATLKQGQKADWLYVDGIAYDFLDETKVVISTGSYNPMQCPVRAVELEPPKGKLITYANVVSVQRRDSNVSVVYKYKEGNLSVPRYLAAGILKGETTSGIIDNVHYMFSEDKPTVLEVSPLNEKSEPVRRFECPLVIVRPLKRKISKSQEIARYYRKKKRSTRKMV